MNDINKTKAQLIAELDELRDRNALLESSESEHKKETSTIFNDKQFFQQIFDAMDDPIYVMDKNYRYIYINKKSCDVWKRERKELINKTIFDLYEKGLAKKHKEEHDLVFDKGLALINELQVNLHGKDYVYSISKAPFINSKTNEKYIVGICRDVTECKKVELALKDSEELLRQIIDLDPHQIYARDVDGRYLLVNKAAAEATKSTVNKITGSLIIDTIPDKKLAQEIIDLDQRIINSNEPSIVKNRKLTDLDGNVRYFDTIKIPFNTSGLNKPAVLGIGLDITDLKKAEEARQESENKYRNLVEMANDGVFVSQDGLIMFCNKRLAEMSGYKVEEITSTPFIDYVSPDERQKVMDIYEKNMKGEDVPSIYELAILHKNGQRLEVESNVGIITHNGKPALLAFVRDITKRKQVENALRKSEEQYRLLIDNQTDLLAKVDMEGRLLFVSPSYCKMIGKSEEELIGEKYMPLIHKQDREHIRKTMENLLIPPYSIDIELRLMTQDGWKWFSWVANVILNDKNEVVEIISTGRDIHDRKMAENALQEAKDSLEERIKERTLELLKVNKKLEKDIAERKKAENMLLKSESILKRQKLDIEQKTVALKEVIGQIESEKNTIKDDISTNVNDIIIPLIEKFRQNDHPQEYVDLFRHSLIKITDSFGRNLTHYSHKLTAREIEICILIEKGFTNKEISSLINISSHTVEKHRRNIRLKLNISNKGINLTTYLREMSL